MHLEFELKKNVKKKQFFSISFILCEVRFRKFNPFNSVCHLRTDMQNEKQIFCVLRRRTLYEMFKGKSLRMVMNNKSRLRPHDYNSWTQQREIKLSFFVFVHKKTSGMKELISPKKESERRSSVRFVLISNNKIL